MNTPKQTKQYLNYAEKVGIHFLNCKEGTCQAIVVLQWNIFCLKRNQVLCINTKAAAKLQGFLLVTLKYEKMEF